MFEIISLDNGNRTIELRVGSLTLALQFTSSLEKWEIQDERRIVTITKHYRELNPKFNPAIVRPILLEEWFQISKHFIRGRIPMSEFKRKHNIIERYLLMC